MVGFGQGEARLFCFVLFCSVGIKNKVRERERENAVNVNKEGINEGNGRRD